MAGKMARSQDPPPIWALHLCPNTKSGTPRASSDCALRLTWDRKPPPAGAGRREVRVCRVISASPALVSGKGPEEPRRDVRCQDKCSSPKSYRGSSGGIYQPVSQECGSHWPQLQREGLPQPLPVQLSGRGHPRRTVLGLVLTHPSWVLMGS